MEEALVIYLLSDHAALVGLLVLLFLLNSLFGDILAFLPLDFSAFGLQGGLFFSIDDYCFGEYLVGEVVIRVEVESGGDGFMGSFFVVAGGEGDLG